MLPSMVAPIIGPLTTPSRIVSCPLCRVNSARNAVKETPLWVPVEPPAATRSSDASPLMEKLRTLIRPSLALGSTVGGSRKSSSWPPITFEYMSVKRKQAPASFVWGAMVPRPRTHCASAGREAEEGPGLIRLQRNDVPALPLSAPAQIRRHRRIASDLAVQRKGSHDTVAAGGSSLGAG